MAILTTKERLGSRLSERYRLDSVLGSGGMGVLFRATDETTGRCVAVKMLKPEESTEPDRVARFRRETRIAATLQHPNIAAFLDSGVEQGGCLYLVMELLEGTSLEQLLAEKRVLAFGEALELVVPIARALATAHARGVIHRDVKPNNIFLARDATGSVVPKLLDFGIARSRKDDFETRTGSFVGTLGYIAPEQAMNRECGPFTDVWATGAVLYRCLTGEPPHIGGSVPEVLARLVQQPVPPLVANGLSRSAGATIDRALARGPDQRHQTMQAFIDALEDASTRVGTERDTSEMPAAMVTADTSPLTVDSPSARSSASSRRWLLVVAPALVVLAASLFSLSNWPHENRPRIASDGTPRSAAAELGRPVKSIAPGSLTEVPSRATAMAPASAPATSAAPEAQGPEKARARLPRTPRAAVPRQVQKTESDVDAMLDRRN
jgi:serine/threonine protein kinase